MPSLIAWCTIAHGADRPPSTPSITTKRHSGTGAVERLLVELRGQVEQRSLGARCWELHVADVEVDVELGIGCPGRWGQAGEPGHDTLVQTRHLPDHVAHRHSEVVEVERAVEDGERHAPLGFNHGSFSMLHISASWSDIRSVKRNSRSRAAM